MGATTNAMHAIKEDGILGFHEKFLNSSHRLVIHVINMLITC
jgi:hypothetical protein